MAKKSTIREARAPRSRRTIREARAPRSRRVPKPLNDYIVVIREAPQLRDIDDKGWGKAQGSNIVQHISSVAKSCLAIVVAVGSGRLLETGHREPPEVEVSNVVVIGKYAGTDIELDGITYTHLREGEILSVVDDADEDVAAMVATVASKVQGYATSKEIGDAI